MGTSGPGVCSPDPAPGDPFPLSTAGITGRRAQPHSIPSLMPPGGSDAHGARIGCFNQDVMPSCARAARGFCLSSLFQATGLSPPRKPAGCARYEQQGCDAQRRLARVMRLDSGLALTCSPVSEVHSRHDFACRAESCCCSSGPAHWRPARTPNRALRPDRSCLLPRSAASVPLSARPALSLWCCSPSPSARGAARRTRMSLVL